MSTTRNAGLKEAGLNIRLEQMKFGRTLGLSVTTQLVLVASISSLLFGYNVSVYNTVGDFVTLDFKWCENELNSTSCTKAKYYSSILSGVVFLGALLGCVFSRVLQRGGVRSGLLVNHMVFLLGGLISACSEGMMTLFLGRLMLGVGVGLATVFPPTYISEISSKDQRGFYGIFHQFSIVLGLLMAGVLGLVFGGSPYDVAGEKIDAFAKIWWRVMMGIPAIVALLGLFMLSVIYPVNTPRYYVEQGHTYDGYYILSQIMTDGKAIPMSSPKPDDDSPTAQAFFEIERNLVSESQTAKQMTLSEIIITSPYNKILGIALLLAVGQQVTGINSLMASSNLLYRALEFPPKIITAISVALYFINVIMTFPAMYLIEAFGRKVLFVGGNLLQAAVLFTGALFMYIMPESRIAQYVGVASTLVFVAVFAMTNGPVLWVYLFEMFPQCMIKNGPACASAINWLAAFIVVSATPTLVDLGPKVSLLIFAIMSFLYVFITALVVKETKGRALGNSPYIHQKSNIPNVVTLESTA